MSPSAIPSPPPKLHVLEVVRFLLALATMAWHYYHWGPLVGHIQQPAIVHPVFAMLCFSVEAFFIISGLVIVFSTEGRSMPDFVRQRFLRLAPALLICASITFVVGLMCGSPNEGMPRTQKYLLSVAVLPLAWVEQGIDDSLWSLKYEIRFYAGIALLVWLTRVRSHALPIALAMLATDAAACALELNGLASFPFVRAVNKLAGHYTAFFALGILLCAALSQQRRSPWMAVAIAGGLTVAGHRVMQESASISARTMQAPASLEMGLAAALVCFAVVALGCRSVAHPSLARWMSVLGSMSYPLYLVHQNAGYELITTLSARLGWMNDPRPLAMVAMVAVSYLIATRLEPAARRVYQSVLRRV